MNIHIYTDGACRGNPGIGGYAYTIYDEFGELWVKSSGSELNTTNNKMEITAAIEALRAVKKFLSQDSNFNIIIHSDSAYLVNCFNDSWISKWNENGWKTYDKKDVLNKDLWEVLNELVLLTSCNFKRISRKEWKIKEVDKEASLALKKLI
jgi:ribonuclease HI